ncbi:AAA domain-containing protein [Suillus spraguei]|nr:AAA domain-containing protein [Suillus spraguei]
MFIHLTRIYHKQGKQFKIITLYDGQRSAIEKQFESANLPWEDKCFDVNPFQGNEEDHIILSLVRTRDVGFLNNARRVNVMLTQCKISMIVRTKRDFMTKGKAISTLIGKLVGPDAWLDIRDIVKGILRRWFGGWTIYIALDFLSYIALHLYYMAIAYVHARVYLVETHYIESHAYGNFRLYLYA